MQRADGMQATVAAHAIRAAVTRAAGIIYMRCKDGRASVIAKYITGIVDGACSGKGGLHAQSKRQQGQQDHT